MIKSKKLFARALYLVFALALVAGLSLVPAVAADTPADTDVGFELSRGDANDTAEWSTDKATETDAMGSYSVKLVESGTPPGNDHVQLIPPSGITVSDLEELTNDWGFWYHVTPTSSGPYLELKFTSGTDYVDITVMRQTTDVTPNAWTEVVLTTSIGGVTYYGSVDGNVVEYVNGGCTTLQAALTALEAEANAPEGGFADWELTRVQVQLWEDNVARTCYIDDVTLDGTTYELEPIFLDAEYYSVGDTVEVTVPNFKANTDSIRVNPVTGEPEDTPTNSWSVSVTSDSDISGITVDLEETGADTGVFTGEFTTVDTLPAAEDELYVQDGDEITVTYNGDADWGTEEVNSTSITALVDDTAPEITIVSPEDDDMTEETTPEISADYSDDTSGIDEDSVEISVDGVDVTDDADADGSGVTYTPEDDLAEGSHDVTVSVSDLAGNEATESWSFRVVSWLETDSVICGDALNELDALDTVGVAVSITGDTGAITVGRYASNPEPDADEPSNLIEDGFFDVQVTACGDPPTPTQVVIKFADANITAESTAHVFDDLQGMWLACSDQGYNPTDEFLWVKVREADTTPNISELSGTPFAISGEAAVAKGDFDDDGDIDIIDFVQFATAYGSELGDDNYNAIGDFDDDGDIDILDFVQFATGYGTSW